MLFFLLQDVSARNEEIFLRLESSEKGRRGGTTAILECFALSFTRLRLHEVLHELGTELFS